MPKIQFQKPKKIEWEVLTGRYGRLSAEPFEKGYALTVGNSLRRTLLSIIPGAAVAWVKIHGVPDQAARIPGVVEDMTDVLLNIKKLAVRLSNDEPAVVSVDVEGPKELTGADVDRRPDVEVLNPDLRVATLDNGGRLAMEIGIRTGRGYVSSGRHQEGTIAPGAIPLDAAFSPIQRVSYSVETSRLGKVIDYERLVFEIWTNGAITPEEALDRTSKLLRDHFSLLAPLAGTEEEAAALEAGGDFLRDALLKDLDELSIPARAVNALKNADIATVAGLVQKTETELEKVKNLGQKSIDEIKTALAGLGLSLGMRIDPNILSASGRGGAR